MGLHTRSAVYKLMMIFICFVYLHGYRIDVRGQNKGKEIGVDPAKRQKQTSIPTWVHIFRTWCWWYSRWWKTVNIGHSKPGTKECLLMAIAETCPHESKVIAFDPAKCQYQTPSQCHRARFTVLCIPGGGKQSIWDIQSWGQRICPVWLLQRHALMRPKWSRLIPSFGSTKGHLSVIPRVLQYSVLQVVENTQYRTNAVGTNQDLFCIHAEVPANKREGRNPSCSRGIAIKLSVSSSRRVRPSMKCRTKTYC